MSEVIGYILEHDGRYKDKWYFSEDINKIATFLLIHPNYSITITDTNDELYISKDRQGNCRYGDKYVSEFYLIKAEIESIFKNEKSLYEFEFIEIEERVQKDFKH